MSSSIGIYDNSVRNEGLFETIGKLVSTLEPIISAYNEWHHKTFDKLVSTLEPIISAYNEWHHKTFDKLVSALEPMKLVISTITDYNASMFERLNATDDFITKNFSLSYPEISIGNSYNQASANQDSKQNIADEICRISNKNFDYDIFLSHSDLDYTYTDELELKLRQHNFRVFYDKRCINWGNYFNQDIKRALKCSTSAIFFVTPNFLMSEYAKKEFRWFFRRNHRRRNHNIYIILYGIDQNIFNKFFPYAKYIQSKTYNGDVESLVFDFEAIFIDCFSNEQKEVIT